MYEKIKRSDEDFIAIGSIEDDRLVNKMNKKDSSKGEEIKQESKQEVNEEDKGEEYTRKRKHSTRKKMKSRKRRFKQDTSQDDPSDIEKRNESRDCGITKAPMRTRKEDLDAVYKLVMDIYQDKIPEGFDKVLWGDLIVMFNPDEQDEFWNSTTLMKVVQ
ncbi:hypothetical protein Tco_0003162 [Tanacetum coccineum]